VFKPLIIIFAIIAFTAAYIVGGAVTISKKIEQYTEDNYKADPVQYEKYTFINATYCFWTAKYERTLELLDKYDQRFVKEENKEKAQFLRARTYDSMLEARRAKDEYKKYMDDFPEGKNFKKADERYEDLKTYS
jgi:hypothetical protein